ncbi:MAG: hypothetical protein ACPKPY_07975 [Nitrososphaeraceae archaeon]
MLESSKKIAREEAILRKFVCEFQKEIADMDFDNFDESGENEKKILWDFIQTQNNESFGTNEKEGRFEIAEAEFSEVYTRVKTYLLEQVNESDYEDDIDFDKSINEIIEFLRMSHELSRDKEIYLRELLRSNFTYLSSECFLADLGLISESEIIPFSDLKNDKIHRGRDLKTKYRRINYLERKKETEKLNVSEKIKIILIVVGIIVIVSQLETDTILPYFIHVFLPLTLFILLCIIY